MQGLVLVQPGRSVGRFAAANDNDRFAVAQDNDGLAIAHDKEEELAHKAAASSRSALPSAGRLPIAWLAASCETPRTRKMWLKKPCCGRIGGSIAFATATDSEPGSFESRFAWRWTVCAPGNAANSETRFGRSRSASRLQRLRKMSLLRTNSRRTSKMLSQKCRRNCDLSFCLRLWKATRSRRLPGCWAFLRAR